ncbi:hypothetical protein C8T65DRAFT_658503 [Cerioporus squamosus]|nr:hypothetical protein C8T65DRAFT_658503 [Cerioporus squamosus]
MFFSPAQRHFSNLLTTRHAPPPSRHARSSSSLPALDDPSEPSSSIKLWPPTPPPDPQPSEEAVEVRKEENGENKADDRTSGQHVAAYLAARATTVRDLVWDLVETQRRDAMDLFVEDAAYVLRMRANRFRYPAKRHTLMLLRALKQHSRLTQIRLNIMKSMDAKEPEWLLQLLKDAGKPDPFKYELAGPGHQVPLVIWPLFRVCLRSPPPSTNRAMLTSRKPRRERSSTRRLRRPRLASLLKRSTGTRARSSTTLTTLRVVRRSSGGTFIFCVRTTAAVSQTTVSRQTAASRINTPDGTERMADDEARAVQQTNDPSEGEETNPASDAPHSPSPPPPHDDAVQPLSSGRAPLLAPPPWPSSPSERGAGEGEGQGGTETVTLTREELLARAAGIRRFTERVFDAYYEVKQPVETADRMTVNALARGAFMLGRDELAFELFNLMRRRDMRLDLHDLNVVISVVAKANPERGIERIQKMIDAGLEPDAVTYGTVIHWAIFHGNAVLVKKVIDMARAHGLENFSFKTLAGLLHATRAAGDRGDILSTMLDLGIIPTPNVGQDCIKAALAAEDPVMAFRFWKELLKDKVEFADNAQRQLRRRIGNQIQEHFDAGWVDENRARVMLSELGFEIFSLHDRRRLAAKERPLPGIDAPP